MECFRVFFETLSRKKKKKNSQAHMFSLFTYFWHKVETQHSSVVSKLAFKQGLVLAARYWAIDFTSLCFSFPL